MAGTAVSTFKVGDLIQPTLDSGRDKYGVSTPFLVSYQDKTNNSITDVPGQTFSEVIKNITSVSTTLTSAVAVGDTIIPVADSTGFAPGDVAKIGSEYQYVISVGANSVTIEVGLDDAHASGDTIETTGNTGIYTCSPGFPLDTAGRYNIIIENPGIRLGNVVIPIEVKETSLEDISSDIADIAEKFGIQAKRSTFQAWAQ